MELNENMVCAQVPCSHGARLNFSWGLGELRMIDVWPAGTQPAEEGHSDAGPCTSIVINTSASKEHRAVATAVAPVAAQVCAAQQLSESPGGGPPPNLQEYAMLVRKSLLQGSTSKTEDGGDVFVDNMASEAALWGLLEVLYVTSPASGGYWAEDLAAWLYEHGPALDYLCGTGPDLPTRMDALVMSAHPDQAADYWPCLVHLVCLGRVRDAMRLLDTHDTMQRANRQGAQLNTAASQQFELVDGLYMLLRQMPRFRHTYTPVSGAAGGVEVRLYDNMSEFLLHRSQWQSQCQAFLDDPHLFDAVAQHSQATARGVRSVVQVLAGNPQCCTDPCHTWLEAAVALLIHVHPQLTLKNHANLLLGNALDARPVEMGQEHFLGFFRELIQQAAAGEVGEVVNLLSGCVISSSWLVAHAFDLLRSVGPREAGSLLRTLPLSGGDQIEYFRLMLAESFMPSSTAAASSSRWQLALQYMMQCPVHGRGAAEAMLEALPVGGSTGANLQLLRKASGTARALNLPATATCLARAAGARAWYAGTEAIAAAVLGGSGGADDWIRGEVVLQPLEAVASAHLTAAGADYRIGSLNSSVDNELEVMVGHTLEARAKAGQGAAGSSWLLAYLHLQDALTELQSCLQPSASGNQDATAPDQAPQDLSPDQADALKQAAKRFLSTALQLLSGGVGPGTAANGFGGAGGAGGAGANGIRGLQAEAVPGALLLPLLARMVPALELPAVAAACGPAELAQLSAAATRAVAAAGAAGQVGARCMTDVQLCVARLACRSHVYGAA